MKKLMLFMAGIAMSLGTHAQFSLDAGSCGGAYWQPCSGITGYSFSPTSGTYYLADPSITDVHGALNPTPTSSFHYMVGDFDNSGDRDIYLLRKNRGNGAIASKYTFDANNKINFGPATNDVCKKMTVDENNHKAYITGTWGPANTPFLACINLNTNLYSWGKSLNTYADINDVLIDASGNVYVLVSNSCSGSPCYAEFSILKYSSGGTPLGSWSTSSWGSTDSYYGYAMEYDGSSKIFVAGATFSGASTGSTLFGIKTNMTFDNTINLTSYPFDNGGFNKIGRNPTNGHIVCGGIYNTGTYVTWAEFDVTTLPTKYFLTSTNGISTSGDEVLTDLLVDPNGKIDLVIYYGGYRHLAWINMSLAAGAGDVDYSAASGSYLFPSSYIGVWANKDEDGSIIVEGINDITKQEFTAKFHDASLTTGTGAWPGYENKSTGINNIHADEISIAPNPASDVLSIQGIDDNADYRISNTLGQVVAKGSISNSKNAQINISGLNQGTYYLQLYSTDKSVITTKPFVKQ